MLSVFIVEDESFMRDGLSLTLPWEAWGFKLIGATENGAKALEALEEHDADLVVTDIRMPVMNGLELLKEIRDRHPRTRVILLSGHEDFYYVREGMKLGASGYVLMLNLLKELPSEVEQAREQILGARLEEEAGRRTRDISKKEALRRLLIGDKPTEDWLGEEADADNLNAVLPENQRYVCFVVHIVNYYIRLKESGTSALAATVAAMQDVLQRWVSDRGLTTASGWMRRSFAAFVAS